MPRKQTAYELAEFERKYREYLYAKFRIPALMEIDRIGKGEHELARDRVRVVRVYGDGSMITAGAPDIGAWYEDGHVCGKRGRITEFSAASRKRMQCTVAALVQSELPILVTLTYPEQWCQDGRVWKNHLDQFGKALRRKCESASMVWKLEPQERGAPHFHGMIYGTDWLEIEWLRETWFRIVDSGDDAHLTGGTRVERARSRKAAMAYMSKRYLGKTFSVPSEWENAGRVWGVINRDALPLAEVVEVQCTRAEIVSYRRYIRRAMSSKGLRFGGDATFTLFTGDPRQWARLLMWVCGEHVPRAELGTRAALGGVDFLSVKNEST